MTSSEGRTGLPGGTLGILGGGQLGLMALREAQRMGYRVHVLDPDPDCPCAVRADLFLAAPFTDMPAALELARGCDVVTIETEHIPAAVLDEVAKVTLMRPQGAVLRNINDRLAQRRFLESAGIPQPAWRPVDSAAGLAEALAEVGSPAILKSRTGGYDGKGQVRIQPGADAAAAWAKMGQPAVLEAFVPFDREVSVLLARDARGAVAAWPMLENVHRAGILHTTRFPAEASPAVAQEALRIATRVVEGLGHVGVAAVEMFQVGTRLIVNEVAPRTHNSGHVTLGASGVSQFEQHVRAVLGLPLARPDVLRPAAMVNLLGDLWQQGPPDWSIVQQEPEARLHLYGKRIARPGRKMGHVLVLADEAGEAVHRAEALHARLSAPRG